MTLAPRHWLTQSQPSPGGVTAVSSIDSDIRAGPTVQHSTAQYTAVRSHILPGWLAEHGPGVPGKVFAAQSALGECGAWLSHSDIKLEQSQAECRGKICAKGAVNLEKDGFLLMNSSNLVSGSALVHLRSVPRFKVTPKTFLGTPHGSEMRIETKIL